MALSKKHQQVINEYVKCWNQTEAYRRVYDCTYDAARYSSARLFANANFSEALQKRLRENAMSADEVLMRLAAQARGDIDSFLDDDGHFSLEKARGAKQTNLMKKYKVRTQRRVFEDYEDVTTTIEFELYDAQSALVHLGKHHKLFVDRQEVTGTIEHDYRSELLGKLAQLAGDSAGRVASQDSSETTEE